MDTWIVMTSSAQVHGRARQYGRYRNVALVRLTDDYAAAGKRPTMISQRAQGVVRIIHLGAHSVGTTERCAYRRALADAQARIAALNAAQ